MIDITMIIKIAIGLLSMIITVILIPYIRTKTSNEKLAKLATIINAAVRGAEQIFTGTGLGETKKEYVIRFLKNYGYIADIDSISDEINLLIESAVNAMNGENKGE